MPIKNTGKKKSPSNEPQRSWPLADATRRKIIDCLLIDSMPVSAIADGLSISRPAVTQHLKILKEAGLVRAERNGRISIYSVDRGALIALALQSSELFDQKPRQNGSAAYLATHANRDRIDVIMDQWSMPWPQSDRVIVGILLRFHLISRTINKLAARAAAHCQLKHGEVLLIAALDQLGPPHQSTLTEISKTMLLSMAGMAKQVVLAEKKGLIVRRPNAQDGRSDLLCLTEEGRKVLYEVLDRERSVEFASLFQVPEQDRLLLAQMSRDQLNTLRKA